MFPSVGPLDPTEPTTAAPTTEEEGEAEGPAVPEEVAENGDNVVSNAPLVSEQETQAPLPARGDGPINIPEVR